MSLSTGLWIALLSVIVGSTATGLLLARWLTANAQRRRYLEGFITAINSEAEAHRRAWWIFGSVCWATAIIGVVFAIWSSL